MPEVQREVAKIQAELARGETFKELASQGNISAKRLFSDELRPRILPLNRVMAFVNMLLTRLEGKLNEKLAVEIATELASSNKAAEAIAAAKNNSFLKAQLAKVLQTLWLILLRYPLFKLPTLWQSSNDTRRPLPADLRPACCAQEQRHLSRQRGAAVGKKRHQSAKRHGAATEGHH